MLDREYKYAAGTEPRDDSRQTVNRLADWYQWMYPHPPCWVQGIPVIASVVVGNWALRATLDRYDVPVDLRKLPLWSQAHGNWTNHVVYAQGNESLILRAACSAPTIYKQWIYLNKTPTPSDHLASLSALSDKFILDRQSFRSSQLTEASAIREIVTLRQQYICVISQVRDLESAWHPVWHFRSRVCILRQMPIVNHFPFSTVFRETTSKDGRPY